METHVKEIKIICIGMAEVEVRVLCMSRLRDKKMMMPFQKARVCMEVCRASFGETSTGGDTHTMETHVKEIRIICIVMV